MTPSADDGRWYYSATGLAELHQRTTGEGVTIALLDGRVNTTVNDLAGADIQPHEPSYCAAEAGGVAYPGTTSEADGRHATSMATMLVGRDSGIAGQKGVPGVAPGVTLRTYPIIVEGAPCETPAGQEGSQDDALRDAIADGADIIAVPGVNNFSFTAIAEALRADVIVVAAGGNDRFLEGLPATYNGVLSVGTVTPDVTLDPGSPVGDTLGAVAPGADIRALNSSWDGYDMTAGSSNATAYTAGALALLWSLYPNATDGQILQSMIHTTDGRVSDKPVHSRDWGYGTVSPRALLTVDPTSYPDENPFLLDNGNAPTVADVLGTAGGEEPDTPGSTEEDPAANDDPTTPVPADPDSGLPTVAVVGAAVAAVALAAVVIVVVARRRRRATDSPTPHHDDLPPTYARGNHG
jgi:hypothetical protein